MFFVSLFGAFVFALFPLVLFLAAVLFLAVIVDVRVFLRLGVILQVHNVA